MAEIKITMDKTAIILSSVVGALGLLSAILGFAGEGANATNPSPGLGICAGIFLLCAQITVSAVGGCCGCCKSRATPSETKRIVGIICSVVSWVAAVIACVLLFVGAWNPWAAGLLASGGALALLATALGIASFVLMGGSGPADKPAGGQKQAASAIPVAQPQAAPADHKQNLAQQPADHGQRNGGSHAPNHREAPLQVRVEVPAAAAAVSPPPNGGHAGAADYGSGTA